eukprot:TRINITY_DN1366_c0_g1_i1.p1 TRINITY_DN1366_c0_g1~~TRINITY_DN1366_c0_g1_i1.p1  ORF type:complete len:203 (+),score=57.94 TRINITY_DN1366_c0_g1_i1:212-820(+)
MSKKENLAPTAIRKISSELRKLSLKPPEGIKIVLNEGDVTDIQAIITGPVGTPYENGAFKVRLQLGSDFPQAPPKGYFLTKIFHPNVSKTGEICVNTLKKDWKENLGIEHVLVVIKCLLIAPNPESSLNEEAGRLLLEAYEDYAKQAKMYTQIHAACKSTEANTEGKSASTTTTGAVRKRAVAAKGTGEKKDTKKKKSLKRL